MYLFLDTETAGLPRDYRAPASDLRNWPRMVQIAWLLADEGAAEIASAEHLVKPSGFTIPGEATLIHGITTEQALQDGVEIEFALGEVAAAIARARALIGHNIAFDEKILGAEFLRAGLPNAIEPVKRRCTMLESTQYCRLPGSRGYKWPTLGELHAKLFDQPLVGAHRALVDVRACARCYFELRQRKVMK